MSTRKRKTTQPASSPAPTPEAGDESTAGGSQLERRDDELLMGDESDLDAATRLRRLTEENEELLARLEDLSQHFEELLRTKTSEELVETAAETDREIDAAIVGPRCPVLGTPLAGVPVARSRGVEMSAAAALAIREVLTAQSSADDLEAAIRWLRDRGQA